MDDLHVVGVVTKVRSGPWIVVPIKGHRMDNLSQIAKSNQSICKFRQQTLHYVDKVYCQFEWEISIM